MGTTVLCWKKHMQNTVKHSKTHIRAKMKFFMKNKHILIVFFILRKIPLFESIHMNVCLAVFHYVFPCVVLCAFFLQKLSTMSNVSLFTHSVDRVSKHGVSGGVFC